MEEFIIKFINTQIGKLINKICTISFYEINTHTHTHIYIFTVLAASLLNQANLRKLRKYIPQGNK